MPGGSGRVCDFFLQGRCKFGDSCKNEHPRGNQSQGNRFAPLSNPPNNSARGRSGAFGGGGDRYRPGKEREFNLNPDYIKLDLTTGPPDGERPLWKLSAYGPGKDAPRQLLGGSLEVSPEELRVQCYLAQASGQMDAYRQNEASAFAEADRQVQLILNDLDGAIQYVVDGANQHPNRNDQVTKPSGPFKTQPAFGQQTGTAAFGEKGAFSSGGPGFGQPSQLGRTSGFGRPSSLGVGGSGFGQPSTLGSAFGQPSTLGIASKFPTPSQPSAGTTFGSPSIAGSSNTAFGAASALGQKPVFGQPSQPTFGQSGFGQAPKSTFGVPAQPASGFGQPSALGSNKQQNPFAPESSQTSRFASTIGQPSAFGQIGQSEPSQPNLFASDSKTSGFAAVGAQAGSNTFAPQPTTTSGLGGAFNQPTQPTTSGFGAPQQTGQSLSTPGLGGPSREDQQQRAATVPPQINGTASSNEYAEAAPEVYAGELGVILKEIYEYVAETGQFKDGFVPEIPPKREWIRWDRQ